MARPPYEMTKAEIQAELKKLDADFAERGDHGGSPGEWIYERMCELETALRRGTYSDYRFTTPPKDQP